LEAECGEIMMAFFLHIHLRSIQISWYGTMQNPMWVGELFRTSNIWKELSFRYAIYPGQSKFSEKLFPAA